MTLFFSLLGARALYSGFVEGSGPIWLDNLGCRGLESFLDNCTHLAYGVHNCNHPEDVGVRCLMGDASPGQCF